MTAAASRSGQRLPVGKLPPDLLSGHVLTRRGQRRQEVLVPAALGEDATVLDMEGDLCVASVDPITGAGNEVGWLAVHVSCNDVAAHGARPVAVLLTILLPEGSRLADLEGIMAGAERAACEVGVEIAGGHTEVTPGLAQPIVTATVIGRATRGRALRSGGVRPGDRIWMSKTAGLEGTAILAVDLRAQLAARGVGEETLRAAEAMGALISVVPEAMAAVEAGATALHDVTEGGVLGALWEMAAAANVGLEVAVERIPVAPPTRAICDALGVDPLKLISSGVLLIAAPPDVDLTRIADTSGVHLTPIARALPPEGGCWLDLPGERRPLEPPQGDELWRAKAGAGDEHR